MRTHFSNVAPATILICVLATQVTGQESATFEVATIKPSDPSVPLPGSKTPEGNWFSMTSAPLAALITTAYSGELGRNFRIEGGPAWITKERFDVVASGPGTRDASTIRAMLRNLLNERFGLSVHTETREVNVFALVPARKDGKLGPNVKPFGGMCLGNAAPPPLQPGAHVARCSAFFRPPGLEVIGASMDVVADLLSSPSSHLERPVIDRTGISGEFDMRLEFDFYAEDPRNRSRQAATGDGVPSVPAGPSLFTAIQEQWGLKLEATKGPVTVLVVDEVHPPTEN